MSINSRTKGANGEREAAEWLKRTFKLEHTPQRNLEQVRYKGSGKVQLGMDLIGFEPFCIEIKRCEQIALKTWWRQCVLASKNIEGSVPLVMYRTNRRQWKFLISAKNIGLDVGFVHLENNVGIQWIKKVLDDASL